MLKFERTESCESCEYSELRTNGETILSGDYYHDKIGKQIEGFLKGIKHCNKVYEVEVIEVNCPYCE